MISSVPLCLTGTIIRNNGIKFTLRRYLLVFVTMETIDKLAAALPFRKFTINFGQPFLNVSKAVK